MARRKHVYEPGKVGENVVLPCAFFDRDGDPLTVSAVKVWIRRVAGNAVVVDGPWATLTADNAAEYDWVPTISDSYVGEWVAYYADGRIAKSVDFEIFIEPKVGTDAAATPADPPEVLPYYVLDGTYTVPAGSTVGKLVAITAAGVAATYATRAVGGPGADAIIYQKLSDTTARLARIATLDVFEGLTPGSPLYLSTAGGVSHTRTGTPDEIDQPVGLALSATRALVFVGEPTTIPHIPLLNDFRLTGVSGAPVMTADSAALSTIYLTPFKGNRITLFDGTAWKQLRSAEVSIAITGRTAGLPVDVFAYESGGNVELELTDWASALVRATGLVRQDGVWCKAGALTRRYLGTFLPQTATSFAWQLSGDVNASGGNQPVRFGLWNADNRVRFSSRLRDSGSSHVYSTATTRAWNGSANARFEAVVGLQEEYFEAQLSAVTSNTTSAGRVTGFGVDSTSAFSGIPAYVAGADTFLAAGLVRSQLGLGARFVAWLQRPYSGTVTWFGVGDGSTALQSGAIGSWTC